MKFNIKLSLIGLLVTACGRDPQLLHEQTPVQVNDTNGTSASLTLSDYRYKLISWYLPCENQPMNIPSAAKDERLLVGPGPHDLPLERSQGVQLEVHGTKCPGADIPRDVMLAVDVSGSMTWNDKQVNGRCQRLDLMNSIIDSLPTTSQISLFTFEEELHYAATKFFATKAELLQDISGTGPLADVICAMKPPFVGGKSDFNVAFKKAKDLFATSRNQISHKELILISDGIAGTTPADDAIALAKEFRDQGVSINGDKHIVTIAGIAIPQTSTIQKPTVFNSLASTTPVSGKLVFLPRDIRALNKVLDDMAKDQIKKFELTVTGGMNKTFDLSGLIKDYEFTVEAFELPDASGSFDLKADIQFQYSKSLPKKTSGLAHFNKTLR